MREVFLIGVIWCAMIATSFWEAYVEGKHAWDKGKLGWKIKWKKHVLLTAYHFWLFWVTFPLLLSLPFLLVGFSLKLFLILALAYISGLVLEDFFWFIVNPAFDFKNFNSKHVTWYPWVKIGKAEIPFGYVLSFLICIIIGYLLYVYK